MTDKIEFDYEGFTVKKAFDIITKSETIDTKKMRVFMEDVPDDYQKTVNLPICRITEMESFDTINASNLPYEESTMIQVDVWGNLSFLNEMARKLDNLFLIDNNFIRSTRGIDKDKDFNNVSRMYRRYKLYNNIKF